MTDQLNGGPVSHQVVDAVGYVVFRDDILGTYDVSRCLFLWILTLQLKSKSQDPLKAKDQTLSHELSLFYPRVAFL